MRKVAPFPYPAGFISCFPPFKYYGGKQRMWPEIKRLVPTHTVRKEPFLGGCTSLALPPVKVELWNDKNPFVVNFYEVAQLWKYELVKRVLVCLNSEHQYKDARELYLECGKLNPVKSTKAKRIEMAWAFFVLCNLSFAGDWNGGYQVSYKEKLKNRIQGKKERIEAFCQRIEGVQLLCRDAVDLIKAGDSEQVWVYADPPYPEADQGHYSGYTWKRYGKLIESLTNMKGMFLLSSYPSKILDGAVRENGWNYRAVVKNCDANNGGKRKIETLTWNYEIVIEIKKKKQKALFTEEQYLGGY